MKANVIEHNPMLKKPLIAILGICAQQGDRSRDDIEAQALEVWDSAYQQNPSVCVDILVRNGALAERLFVDGGVYAGTLDDLQADESVPEDAHIEARLSLIHI